MELRIDGERALQSLARFGGVTGLQRDHAGVELHAPFGGWKGSGTTGKAIASFYYLPQYLREQSQTVVE